MIACQDVKTSVARPHACFVLELHTEGGKKCVASLIDSGGGISPSSSRVFSLIQASLATPCSVAQRATHSLPSPTRASTHPTWALLEPCLGGKPGVLRGEAKLGASRRPSAFAARSTKCEENTPLVRFILAPCRIGTPIPAVDTNNGRRYVSFKKKRLAIGFVSFGDCDWLETPTWADEPITVRLCQISMNPS